MAKAFQSSVGSLLSLCPENPIHIFSWISLDRNIKEITLPPTRVLCPDVVPTPAETQRQHLASGAGAFSTTKPEPTAGTEIEPSSWGDYYFPRLNHSFVRQIRVCNIFPRDTYFKLNNRIFPGEGRISNQYPHRTLICPFHVSVRMYVRQATSADYTHS